MLYLAGIIIAFFLLILLLGKKGKSEADRVLAFWLIVIGFHLLAFYLYISGKYVEFPWFLGAEIALPLVHGPFLYLYTIALTQARRIRPIGLLHFLPAVITNILMIPFFLLPVEEKIEVYQNKGAGYQWLTQIVFIALVASGIIYVILSFLRLRYHKRNIENQFSNTARINLNWLRYLTYGTSAIWIVIIVGLGDIYIFGTVVIYVFFIGYFGVRQVGIFSSPSLSHKNINGEIEKDGNSDKRNESEAEPVALSVKPKYQKSSLTQEEAKKIHGQLQHLMIRDKLFKDPDLNLGELAEGLKVHPNTLSQVINTFENKSFYDYVNGLRIEEFKTLAVDPATRQYTLLSLAYECGFNSKTAFNRNFRKATGSSPSEYLSRIKMNVA